LKRALFCFFPRSSSIAAVLGTVSKFVTWSLATTSSSISRRRIRERPITSRPIAKAPTASAPIARAPKANAPAACAPIFRAWMRVGTSSFDIDSISSARGGCCAADSVFKNWRSLAPNSALICPRPPRRDTQSNVRDQVQQDNAYLVNRHPRVVKHVKLLH
jgi:hypothetical protein